MLEKSSGVLFFLKAPTKKSTVRYLYVRITVDGIPKETSTKRKWDASRWDQKKERAIGTKEDAQSLNFFITTLINKLNNFKTELIKEGITISVDKLIDFINGKKVNKATVLEEFSAHNNEMLELVSIDEYAIGTYKRFRTTKTHLESYIRFKYDRSDLEFRQLDYEFVTDFLFYLKTSKNIAHNTALKYLTNVKKIVLRAIAKKIIKEDPFILYKAKKQKIKKTPLSRQELKAIEEKKFSNQRLELVRDIFVFQCYTGLAYIDVKDLKRKQIKEGIDGGLWIIKERQKTKAEFSVPLLPTAIEIMRRYRDHPDCSQNDTILPVKSNQKMNEYLKEIADLCGIPDKLTTHKARRTFGSTVTLNNGVPINVVKEMLGHQSVKQTEEYALTEQETISREMKGLRSKLDTQKNPENDPIFRLNKLCADFEILKSEHQQANSNFNSAILIKFEQDLEVMKSLLLH